MNIVLDKLPKRLLRSSAEEKERGQKLDSFWSSKLGATIKDVVRTPRSSVVAKHVRVAAVV